MEKGTEKSMEKDGEKVMTRNFKLTKDSNINHFIDFAEGDPYYLDFSEGGQDGTISWSEYTVKWESIEDGFKVSYTQPDDDPIIGQIELTVKAYNSQKGL